MESLITKLRNYELVNNVIVGAIIYHLGMYCLKLEPLKNLSLIGELSIVYFVGLVVSRIGSLVLEPVCKTFKIVLYAPPEQYYAAEKKDKKISDIVEANNMYRSLSAGFFMILFAKFVLNNWPTIMEALNPENVILWILAIGFILAFRKQTGYVRRRVEAALKADESSNEHK